MGCHQEKYYEVKDQRSLGDDRFIERIEGKEENFWPTIYDISIEMIS